MGGGGIGRRWGQCRCLSRSQVTRIRLCLAAPMLFAHWAADGGHAFMFMCSGLKVKMPRGVCARVTCALSSCSRGCTIPCTADTQAERPRLPALPTLGCCGRHWCHARLDEHAQRGPSPHVSRDPTSAEPAAGGVPGDKWYRGDRHGCEPAEPEPQGPVAGRHAVSQPEGWVRRGLWLTLSPRSRGGAAQLGPAYSSGLPYRR